MIKDKLFLSSDSSLLFKKCLSCSKNSHALFKCPLINPLIIRTHLINKITANKPQVREPFLRKNYSKFNARKKISSLQKNQILFYMNRTTSEDSISKMPKKSISSSDSSSGKEKYIQNEKIGKLSMISEKEEENSSDYSYENILSTKKKSLAQSNEKLLSIKSNEDNDSDDSIEEEKIICNLDMKKKYDEEQRISDYDTQKLYKNYQPHFNYNVILTVFNNEMSQERFVTQKKGKKQKKYKINYKKSLKNRK